MSHEVSIQPDYGTGQKKLGIYLAGVVSCAILTIIAFWIVMSGQYEKTTTFIVIYSAAFIQFVIQVICFLRLNIKTPQGINNVLSFIFTLVILTCVLMGSLWIMWSLGYNMNS